MLIEEGIFGEGEDLSSYLRVQIKQLADGGRIQLSQPYLIVHILEVLVRRLVEFKMELHKDENGPERKWD